MAKIVKGVGPTFPAGDGQEREHPGHGVPMEGIEYPADGTMSPPIGNDDSESAPVATEPPARVPTRMPPRRTPPPVPDE